jgi:long-chain acyl-CoA synthetase
MFELKTVNDVMLRATGRGGRAVMMWQTADDIWKPITSDELYGRVRALARVLRAWGVGAGDRVALLSENRWEWPVTDLATLAIGAVDVPLYATLTPEQLGYALRDSGAKVIVLSSEEQYRKLGAAGDLPDLQHVIVMDEGSFGDADSFSLLLKAAPDMQQRHLEFDDAARAVRSEDLATIIYTSGTTGEPKGVMLTHGNLASNVSVSTDRLEFNDTDSCISFLPLSHVTARHVDYALMCHGATLAYCSRFDLLPKAMKDVRPTIFIGVPRVFEKIRHATETKAGGSPIRSKLFRWALAQGKEHASALLTGVEPTALGWRLANRLVYAKVRAGFGGRVKSFISGGAPLGMDTASWFANVGIRIFEGYGLTETSPVISINVPSAHKIGTVGQPIVNVECRFAMDEELEVRGPSIFSGYWKKDGETTEAFTTDGWFKTGDIGSIDESGFLSITDRKKELLKTSGGKMIAPQPIENQLKANVLVAQAAMVGDKHKFASVIISPNFDALAKWADANAVAFESRRQLVDDERVKRLYQGIVDQVNGRLAPYESVKRTCVVGDEWTIEDGELTPSLKLKRRVIERKYAKEIAAFYADEAVSSSQVV